MGAGQKQRRRSRPVEEEENEEEEGSGEREEEDDEESEESEESEKSEEREESEESEVEENSEEGTQMYHGWFKSAPLLSHEAFTLDQRLIEEVKQADGKYTQKCGKCGQQVSDFVLGYGRGRGRDRRIPLLASHYVHRHSHEEVTCAMRRAMVGPRSRLI